MPALPPRQPGLVTQWPSAGPPLPTLHAVWGGGPDDVYVAGESGTIRHSADHGATWITFATGTTEPLFALWGSGPDDVYAVGGGKNGLVLHSSDHGATWSRRSLDGIERLVTVWGSGPDDIYAASHDTVYRSTDRSGTWMRQTPAHGSKTPDRFDPADVRACDPIGSIEGAAQGDLWLACFEYQPGYDYERALFRSRDHGATWRRTATYEACCYADYAPAWVRPTALRVHPAGADVYAVGGELALGGSYAQVASSTVASSHDGGTSWTFASLGGQPHVLLRPERGFSLDDLWSDGRRFAVAVGLHGVIARTEDGAKSWATGESGVTNDLEQVWATSPSDIYAVGEEGIVLHSSDRGKHWILLDGREAYRPRLYGAWRGGEHAIEVGEGGIVLRSEDGGASWTVARPGGRFDLDLNDVVGSDSAHLYAVGGYERIASYRGYAADGIRLLLRSTDGGATWKEVPIDVMSPGDWGNGFPCCALLAAWASGPRDLYAVGYGSFLHTKDGGKSWSAFFGCGTPQVPCRLCARRPGDVWVVKYQADDRLLYFHSSDHGVTWQPGDVPPEGPGVRARCGLVDLCRRDGNEILRSHDGGETWITDFTGDFKSVAKRWRAVLQAP